MLPDIRSAANTDFQKCSRFFNVMEMRSFLLVVRLQLYRCKWIGNNKGGLKLQRRNHCILLQGTSSFDVNAGTL